jgi:dihydrofolate reductase
MSKVILNISMSLDGFIAGPNIRPEEPMGDAGERLHEWMFEGSKTDEDPKELHDEFFENSGAYIMGKRTFDLGLEPWGENPPFHAPCFVLSDEPRDTIARQGGTSYIFVADGIESTLKKAQEAAGNKDVVVMGGANAAQQYLNASLLDEIFIHLVHILLGNGTRLFDNLKIKLTDLEEVAVTNGPGVTHLKFHMRR